MDQHFIVTVNYSTSYTEECRHKFHYCPTDDGWCRVR